MAGVRSAATRRPTWSPPEAGSDVTPKTLIEFYRAIEDSSSRMLEAARTDDWDEVVRLEGACAVLIEQLRLRSRTEDLNQGERSEKVRIMQRILSNDAQIRYLAEPWLAHFEKKFESLQQMLH
jgi:flagellar protein FliT